MTEQVKPKTVIFRVKCPLTLMDYYFNKKSPAEKFAAKANLIAAKALNPKAKKKQLAQIVSTMEQSHLFLVFEEFLYKPADVKHLINNIEIKMKG